MSRLGGAGAVAQLVADVPVSAVEVIIQTNTSTIKFENVTSIFTSYSFNHIVGVFVVQHVWCRIRTQYQHIVIFKHLFS